MPTSSREDFVNGLLRRSSTSPECRLLKQRDDFPEPQDILLPTARRNEPPRRPPRRDEPSHRQIFLRGVRRSCCALDVAPPKTLETPRRLAQGRDMAAGSECPSRVNFGSSAGQIECPVLGCRLNRSTQHKRQISLLASQTPAFCVAVRSAAEPLCSDEPASAPTGRFPWGSTV